MMEMKLIKSGDTIKLLNCFDRVFRCKVIANDVKRNRLLISRGIWLFGKHIHIYNFMVNYSSYHTWFFDQLNPQYFNTHS